VHAIILTVSEVLMVLQACSITGLLMLQWRNICRKRLQQIEKDQTRVDTWRRKAEKLAIRLH